MIHFNHVSLKYDNKTTALRDINLIYQGIPVDKQLPGGFGNVQIVLKEFMDGEQRLLIQGLNGAR